MRVMRKNTNKAAFDERKKRKLFVRLLILRLHDTTTLYIFKAVYCTLENSSVSFVQIRGNEKCAKTVLLADEKCEK